MLNCKVICHRICDKTPDFFDDGGTYSVIDGFLLDKSGGHYNYHPQPSIEELNKACAPWVSVELAHDLPRICYVLGGEDNPLKIGENFKVANDPCTYFANRYGVYTTGGTPMSSQTLFDIINHPEKIIHRPQFSDDEILLMQAFVANGYPWVTKTIHGFVWISKAEPDLREDGCMQNAAGEVLFPEEFFPSLKKESKLNMTEYLESEESRK